MRRIRFYLCLAVLLAAFAEPALALPSAGQPVPQLKGTLVTGEQFDLATVIKDKVAVVFFWSST